MHKIHENSIAGLFIWFIHLTNYSFRGHYTELVLMPSAAVGIWFLFKKSRSLPVKEKKLIKFSWMPAFLGAAAPTLLCVLAITPPFLFVTVLAIGFNAEMIEIQSAPSPSDSLTAYVTFQPVGAFAGGNGRIFITVRRWAFPFIEKQIYYVSRSFADKNTRNYVQWVDECHLEAREPTWRAKPIQINACELKLVMPSFFRMFFKFGYVGFKMVEGIFSRNDPPGQYKHRPVRACPENQNYVRGKCVKSSSGN